MDRTMNGWTIGWTEGLVGWLDITMDGQRCADGWAGGDGLWMNRQREWIDGQKGWGWMQGWMGGSLWVDQWADASMQFEKGHNLARCVTKWSPKLGEQIRIYI